MATFWTRAAVAVGALAALGCGAEAGPAADPAAAACQAMATQRCAVMQKCAPFALAAQFGTAATCTKRFAAVCQARLGATDTGYDVATVNACTASLGASFECEFFGAIDASAACQPKPGKRKNAAACGDDGQCTSGYCRGLDSSTCGNCGGRAKVTQLCNVQADCETGLACVASTGTKVCVARATVGGSCDATHVCLAPAVCKSGKCTAPVAKDAACDDTLKNCDQGAGLYCHTNKLVCTAYKEAAAGQDCGYFSGDRVTCPYGTTCKLIGNGQGTCEAVPDEGGGCSTGSQVACRAGLVCDSGVCKVLQPNLCK